MDIFILTRYNLWELSVFELHLLKHGSLLFKTWPLSLANVFGQ